MATLSFNPARIRTPTFKHSKLTSQSKPITIPCTTPSNNLPKLLHFRTRSVSESTQKEAAEAVLEEEEEDDPTAELSYVDPETDPESITEWELDFCSRPILDARGKKIWELVVCDKTLSLQYTKYFPNNVINSITLKDAIAAISDELGVPLPRNIRFFRSQMQTIITNACNELRIRPIPSKRCVSIILWLEERYETVYTRHPGFQEGSKPLLALDNPFPTELPDILYGERWAFVQLPYSVVREEVSSLERGVCGAGLDLDLLGLEIDDKTLIPGLAVASSSATALAALINGLEVYAVEADAARARLILSVGISTRYVYSTYKKTPETTSEAEAWEAAKKACGGLHFLAVQPDLDSEDCVGFFLLLDLPFPPV
ncbi:nucleotide excision repair, TFIIH, subunit TTDA protein [Spatholobus suberectus]|nr:nucleotide excision repair, TFIIH, subunit TTDA protein [Spatholobus suberectus]